MVLEHRLWSTRGLTIIPQMLSNRMAVKPILYLASWAVAATMANAAAVNIAEDIINYVPPCAQDCFRSFISENFWQCGMRRLAVSPVPVHAHREFRIHRRGGRSPVYNCREWRWRVP